MGGNVAEWVADVYRPIIDEEASDFSIILEVMYIPKACQLVKMVIRVIAC